MVRETEIAQVLCMKEGTAENSYSKTAYTQQRQILSMSKSLRENVIREFYRMEHPTTLCIADLGCSSSDQNCLSGVLYGLIETIDKARREFGHGGPQEYHICLNDLPGNDFNTVFRSVTSFKEKLKQEMGDDYGHCFVNGVPGSFYGRLFPTNSLHFVHSSASLHWLSQVPEEIEENKRNIYMAKTSPTKVINSYYEQFTKDFSMFLRCRSKEVVAGGKMVLTLPGRQNNDPCYSKDSAYMWEYLAKVLNDMVSEGYVEEEKLNTFNIPIYTPSPSELEYLVAKEGSFALNDVHTFKVSSWDSNDDHKFGCSIDGTNRDDTMNLQASCMRAVAESLISSHFGEAIIDEVFRRYKEIVLALLAKEKTVLTNVTISLTRRERG
ncbi:salicylate carboxymethyltransferase-like isoform X1 [Chenopodium quinoa]|uniref:salicylate carboxymethyltransferase-like isoform X1 n=1 Tax=Chenopodium quinoa TaxID=63459 RepID=UPI000B782E9C|nr:salicylate carboxymethyltransferase-like isoform X1 [Chenopodium quinoa]